MASIAKLTEQEQKDIVDRLKRIEGQAKGVQRMVHDGRDCVEVLDQIAAIKAAVNALSGELVEAFALHCLQNPEEFRSSQDAVAHAVKALVRAGR